MSFKIQNNFFLVFSLAACPIGCCFCYHIYKEDTSTETIEQPVRYGHDDRNQQNIGTPASQQIPMQSFQSYPQQSHNFQTSPAPPSMAPAHITQSHMPPPPMAPPQQGYKSDNFLILLLLLLLQFSRIQYCYCILLLLAIYCQQYILQQYIGNILQKFLL